MQNHGDDGPVDHHRNRLLFAFLFASHPHTLRFVTLCHVYTPKASQPLPFRQPFFHLAAVELP